MKTYITSVLVCALFAFASQSHAQSKEPFVSGTVVAHTDGSPLPGVNVLIAGTSLGTTTDVEGRFSLPMGLKIGDKLVFSYLSYATETYVVAGTPNETVSIRLKEEGIIIGDEIASNDHYSLKTRRGILAILKKRQ